MELSNAKLEPESRRSDANTYGGQGERTFLGNCVCQAYAVCFITTSNPYRVVWWTQLTEEETAAQGSS